MFWFETPERRLDAFIFFFCAFFSYISRRQLFYTPFYFIHELHRNIVLRWITKEINLTFLYSFYIESNLSRRHEKICSS